MTAMYVCNKCERKFDHRAAFNRHQRRKTVCRKPTCSCIACERKFVSEESLAKHKKYYCKERGGLEREEPPVPAAAAAAAANTSSLSNILSALYARDNTQQTSSDFATTFHELLESLKPVLSPTPPSAQPSPSEVETTVVEEVIETGNQQQQQQQ